MFSNYLSSIEGVSIYPIIALLLFFTVFLIVVIRVLRMKKSDAEKMGRMPLDIEFEINKNSEKNDEKK